MQQPQRKERTKYHHHHHHQELEHHLFLVLIAQISRTMQRFSAIHKIRGFTTRFVHVIQPTVVLVRFNSSSSSASVVAGINVTKTIKSAGAAATPVTATSSAATPPGGAKGVPKDACGPEPALDEEEDDMEEMFVQGPAGMEWGGPTRGGRRPEPTRFGDWERNGRASDF
jgi:hypothetical protein